MIISEIVDLESLSEEEISRTIRRVARQVREARGWTCEVVSEMLEMSVSEYQELESGDGFVPHILTLRLALTLHVPAEALMGLVPVNLAFITVQETLIERIKKAARLLRSISPEEEKAFLDDINELCDMILPTDDELWSPFLPSSTFA